MRRYPTSLGPLCAPPNTAGGDNKNANAINALLVRGGDCVSVRRGGGKRAGMTRVVKFCVQATVPTTAAAVVPAAALVAANSAADFTSTAQGAWATANTAAAGAGSAAATARAADRAPATVQVRRRHRARRNGYVAAAPWLSSTPPHSMRVLHHGCNRSAGWERRAARGAAGARSFVG